jgi:hypothetical protein
MFDEIAVRNARRSCHSRGRRHDGQASASCDHDQSRLIQLDFHDLRKVAFREFFQKVVCQNWPRIACVNDKLQTRECMKRQCFLSFCQKMILGQCDNHQRMRDNEMFDAIAQNENAAATLQRAR